MACKSMTESADPTFSVTALQAIADPASMAKEDCLFGLARENVFARLNLMRFSEPLDVGEALQEVLIHLLTGLSVLEQLLRAF